ncbi:MAG: hypothetical protein JSW72_01530 [Candidatus Bathyarchaeota archaeon]|nr:MAG: hypothetical protein JSW72_01530 [Candidatus Bathyarchaeota archaeon]
MFRKLAKTLLFLLLLVSVMPSWLTMAASGFFIEENEVFTYINEPPHGNWTFTRRPAIPMKINESQIRIGANWTFVYTITANRSYHIYCYGDWITDGPAPHTDYDIYVYNPLGELEGYHTEAAGLPEHLGTTVNGSLFVPKYTGNYSFVVRNDPRESQASEPATFMAIEHIEPNVWHSQFIEGKQGNVSTGNTGWAYEFTTSSEHVEIQTQVPDTLDMYEMRLYLMADPGNNKGELLNGAPLAWEPGLYGEVSGIFGGYNLKSEGFRGTDFASCEFFGQDMIINYTTPFKGEKLYHLALIGEFGAGDVNFRVKTDFGNSELRLATPIQRVYPHNETFLTAVSNSSYIHRSFLHYSTDNWNTSTVSEMLVNNRACNGTISGQEAGTIVHYRVESYDYLDNLLTLNGSFSVKHSTFVNVTLGRETIALGENLSLSGFVRPALGSTDASVKLIFTTSNGSKVVQHHPVRNGNFSASFKPSFMGVWSVQAQFDGDSARYESLSDVVNFVVAEPPFMSRYSMYIYVGIGAIFVVVVVVIVLRRRQ